MSASSAPAHGLRYRSEEDMRTPLSVQCRYSLSSAINSGPNKWLNDFPLSVSEAQNRCSNSGPAVLFNKCHFFK